MVLIGIDLPVSGSKEWPSEPHHSGRTPPAGCVILMHPPATPPKATYFAGSSTA